MRGIAIHLRAATRQAMDAALTAAGLPTESVDWLCVDHIGPHIVGGIYGPNGEKIASPVTDDRWHTNILPMRDLTAEQLAVLPIVTPSSPSRTFA